LMGKFREWVDMQRKIVGAGNLAEWVKSLDIDAVWKDIQKFLTALKNMLMAINWIVQAIGGWGNAMMLLAGIISLKLLSPFIAFGSQVLSIFYALNKASILLAFKGLAAVAKGFLALGAAAPLAIIFALAGLAYVIMKNWDGIVGYFKNLWQGVKDAFAENWVNGILKFLWDFNPLRLIMKGLNELVAYIAGFNPFEEVTKRWGKTLTSWMPDWMKEKIGFGAPAVASGEPVNIGPEARSIAETRSEHVEKNELEVFVRTESGARAEVRGRGGEGVSWQVGEQGYGY